MKLLDWLFSTAGEVLTKAVNLCPLLQVEKLSMTDTWQPCAYHTRLSTEPLETIIPFKILNLSIGAIELNLVQRLIIIDSVTCSTDLAVVPTVNVTYLPSIPTFLTDFVRWLDITVHVNRVDLHLLGDTSPHYDSDIAIQRLNLSWNRLLLYDIQVLVNRFQTIVMPHCSLIRRGSHVDCDLHGEINRIIMYGDSWYIMDNIFNSLYDRLESMQVGGLNGSATVKNVTVACTVGIGTVLQRSFGDLQFDTRITGVNIESIFEPEQTDVRMTCQRIESTIGYIENGMRAHLTKQNQNWSGIIDVSAVFILAKQDVVDVLITTYNFLNTFEEYERIYRPVEMPIFSRITVLPLDTNIQYHAKPFDTHKVLQGNFKSALSLIPPCDMHIVFPEVLLGNQEGWEALGEAYFTNLLKTQKKRCAKKLVKSYTVYKVKKLFRFFRTS